jgi:hypothetical protein
MKWYTTTIHLGTILAQIEIQAADELSALLRLCLLLRKEVTIDNLEPRTAADE